MHSIANTVPYEIWQMVAHHVPDNERPKLLSVSRCFLSIVLHEKYGEVRWVALDREMVRYLERLQEPYIAQLVRNLHIQAWFINFLARRSQLFRTSMKISRGNLLAVLKHWFILRRKTLNRQGPSTSISSSKKKDPSLFAPAQVLALMVNALSNMSHLTSYSFEWRDLPLNRDSEVFLMTAQNSARRLRRLALHAQLPNFNHLLNFVDFEFLEELKFHFDYETHNHSPDGFDSDRAPKTNVGVLVVNIAPFINRFKSSLHALTLSSSSTTPLAALFDALGVFPNLRYLELNMQFDETILPTPDSLIRFLDVHSSPLLHVKFIPPHQRDLISDDETKNRAKVAAWSSMNRMLQATPSNLLSQLETLYLPASAPMDVTLMILRRSITTLTRLCLSGHYLSPPEFSQILDAFSERPLHSSLVFLRIELEYLNLSLLAKIAKRFPFLHELVIITQKSLEPSLLSRFFVPALVSELFHGGLGVGSQVEHAPPLSQSTLQTLEDWKLCDIGIYVERFQQFQTASFATFRAEYSAMEDIRESVPSIQYFKGQSLSLLGVNY